MDDKYPFPAKAMILLTTLYKEKKLNEDEIKILNEALLNYMDLRVAYREQQYG